MSNNNMTAKQAREQAISFDGSSQLTYVQQRIEDASKKGLFKIAIYEGLTIFVQEKLKSLGYSIFENFDQREGYTVIISW